MQRKNTTKYVGIYNDTYGGMTDSGKVIRYAWIFGLIPEEQTCEGWLTEGIQDLWRKTSDEWEKYGFMVNNLPPEVRERFDRIQKEAIIRARESGWNPDDNVIENPSISH